MKARKLSIASAAAAIMAASLGSMSIALAESPHVFSANVALTTNYMFRGVSQTNNGPAIQGGFDYEYSPYNLYAGVWASNVDSSSGAYVYEDPTTGEMTLTPQTEDAEEITLQPAGYDGASMELDIYAGWAPSWQGIDFDLGYLRYQYPNTDTSDNNTDEFHLGLSYDVMGYFTPSYTAHYSNDWFGTGSAWYHDVSVEIPLPYNFTLAGHYGWNRFDDDTGNYQDYSVGISTEYMGFGLGLSWVSRSDEDLCSAPFQCGDTGVLTLSKSF
jgi:predicted porin